jgi:hypothetical protein
VSEPFHPSDTAGDQRASAALLPESVVVPLRTWLWQLQAARPSTPFPTDEVQRRMHGLCDEAHDRGLRVEQLIVLLKDLWRAAPAAAGWRASGDDGLTDRARHDGVVRICIEAFYRSTPNVGRRDDTGPPGAGRA